MFLRSDRSLCLNWYKLSVEETVESELSAFLSQHGNGSGGGILQNTVLVSTKVLHTVKNHTYCIVQYSTCSSTHTHLYTVSYTPPAFFVDADFIATHPHITGSRSILCRRSVDCRILQTNPTKILFALLSHSPTSTNCSNGNTSEQGSRRRITEKLRIDR